MCRYFQDISIEDESIIMANVSLDADIDKLEADLENVHAKLKKVEEKYENYVEMDGWKYLMKSEVTLQKRILLQKETELFVPQSIGLCTLIFKYKIYWTFLN